MLFIQKRVFSLFFFIITPCILYLTMKKTTYFPVSIQIERLSSKGFGVGPAQKIAGSPLTKTRVPCTVPGDLVVAEIGPKNKGAYLGKLLAVSKASPDRREAVCFHAAVCGGCSLHYMSYNKQLEYKLGIIKNLFSSLFEGDVFPIAVSPLEWNYRNKMEYTFSQNKEGEHFLGLMKAGTKGRVESLTECHLSPSWFIQVLSSVRSWWDRSGLLAFHGVQDIGSLRNLTVREGKKTGRKMVILTVSGNPEYALKKEHLTSFVSAVQAALGTEAPSIFLRIQQTVRRQPTQFYEMNLLGSNHIEEELEIACLDYKRTYRFKISPTAFFQPNTLQAERLYSKALEIAGLRKRNLILDLYAGTATLGMIFSSFAEKVIAIELNPYAVFDAEANRELNQVNNLEVFKGDVSKVLKELKDKDPSFKPDLMLLDPPRTGLFPEAIEEVISLAPSEILYISCAPEKQARDCLLFKQAGYEIVSIQPLDQFPQTVHIENIVLLHRSKGSR